MRDLGKSYGKRTWDVWNASRPSTLTNTQTSPAEADQAVWPVSSFRSLIEYVAFLGSMNKRLTLFYRGQRSDTRPLPVLFRDKWIPFGATEPMDFAPSRPQYWRELERIGQQVYDICVSQKFGLPRRRGLRDIREVQWSVMQHYGLWPTPLIDITTSLRVAAAFAMGLDVGSSAQPRNGFVYVIAMPHSTGSITFDIDQHIVLARLQSCCPPVAKRPHYQEGFLVGRFPMYDVDISVKKVGLLNRLVAKFRLEDAGRFWDSDFPMLGKSALIPKHDPLLEQFVEHFGPQSPSSLHELATKLAAG